MTRVTDGEPDVARVAVAPPAFIRSGSRTKTTDWLDYFDPDVVVATAASNRELQGFRRRIGSAAPVFAPGRMGDIAGRKTVESVEFVFATDRDDLRTARIDDVGSGAADGAIHILSNLMELEVDTGRLETEINGFESYRALLGTKALEGTQTHISTGLPGGYRREWDGLELVGCGGVRGDQSPTTLRALDCHRDGRVVFRTVRGSQLGLHAIEGIGTRTAERLRRAGYNTRNSVAHARPSDLQSVDGLGAQRAKRIVRSARAITNGVVVRHDDHPVVDGDPLYIDIETDGLNPSITWLIGVLDGGARDGEFRAFLNRSPERPGGAIDGFLDWYLDEARGRPLVAYNGDSFDFAVLKEHIREYCPDRAAAWHRIDTWDPYRWAVGDGHAALPGRTNALSDVAAALGESQRSTGLTGAAVARQYRRWATNQSANPVLDWDRYVRYCEDDVRSLARVVEAITETHRLTTSGRRRDVGAATRQRSLTEW